MSWDIYTSVSATAAAIRNRSISVVEVVQAHLDRIEQVNPALNAVVQLNGERALLSARMADAAVAAGEPLGPLHGVPMTIKDSIDTADFITSWGTVGRREYIPPEDATVVKRLRSAGAILLGKTNTPEMTLGGEMNNTVYGPTNNPYDLSRSPSGSSGGAAAILAAGGSALDIGSDTGGSIRDPAHVCGIVGIKPTHGLVPLTGHSTSFDAGPVAQLTTMGPMARCVDDLILTLPIVAGPDRHDPTVVPMPLKDPASVRIGDLRVAYYFEGGLDRPIKAICDAILSAAELLEGDGAKVINAAPPVLLRAGQIYDSLCFADRAGWLRRLLKRSGTQEAGEHLQRFLEASESTNIADLPFALEWLARFRTNMWHYFQDYDVILCPINVDVAQPHGASVEVDTHQVWTHMNAYNLTGWPSVAIRGGENSAGLPFGFQIVARPWRDDVALAVGKFLEERLGRFTPSQIPHQ